MVFEIINKCVFFFERLSNGTRSHGDMPIGSKAGSPTHADVTESPDVLAGGPRSL